MADGTASSPLGRHFLYWMLPSAFTLAMIFAYFSGVAFLRDLVASPVNREFGLLENIQLVIIGVATWIAISGFRRATGTLDKALFAAIAIAAIFAFLEEMDYGIHFYELFFGSTGLEVRNVHNQPGKLKIIKNLTEAVTIGFFVVLPLVAPYIRNPLVRAFAPDKLIVATVAAGLGLGLFAHQLDDAGLYLDGPLKNNISEFRETFTYWLMMLYCLELRSRLPLFARGD